jgi:multicomponent K+:H+ antiporter subunit C
VSTPTAGGPDGAAPYADPVPQALVLTAIVIGFAMSAFVLVLAIRARAASGTDHVDGAATGVATAVAPDPGGAP